MIKRIYNTDSYPFLEALTLIFGIKDLSSAHTYSEFELLRRENDQKTIFHRKYYDNFELIKPIYEDFIRFEIVPIFGQALVYQKIPTFRIQIPNNVGVGEWHKDKQYNHNQAEINFFLPFTRAWDTNTIWAESEEDKGDFTPIVCDYGEFVQWRGVSLTHGNKINQTNASRVSVDFRIIPLSQWIPTDGSAINTGVKFDIGGYYEIMT
jgi:hypothetical protein